MHPKLGKRYLNKRERMIIGPTRRSSLYTLKKHAKTLGVRVLGVRGYERESYREALAMVEEFSELSAGCNHVIYNVVISPDTGLHLLLQWTGTGPARE